MKFKFKGTVHGWMVILEDGSVLGEVFKTYRHGYTYWRPSGQTALFSTRVEAAGYLLAKRECRL